MEKMQVSEAEAIDSEAEAADAQARDLQASQVAGSKDYHSGTHNPEAPEFIDALFREKRKKGKFRLVEPPQLEASVVDMHTHLQQLKNPGLALARAAVHNVEFLVTMVDVLSEGDTTFHELDSWCEQARELLPRITPDGVDANTLKLPYIRIAAGVHPHYAKDYTQETENALICALEDERVCAVGEIGLDYHYDFSPREDQKRVFARQVKIAQDFNLPMQLHVRDAHDEAYALMEDANWSSAGVLLHCFTSDWETLAPWIDAGCFVTFGGAITFKKSDEVRDAASHVPLSQLLTETDAPYMAPEPLRGYDATPDEVVFSAARLAEVCGCEPGCERKKFLQQIAQNAHGLFDRKRS